jgi:DNA-binding transcriptional MocR family regulator
VLVQPGDQVLVESPSYPNALDALAARGVQLLPVPLIGEDPAAFPVPAPRGPPGPAPARLPDARLLQPHGVLLDERARRQVAVSLEQSGVVALVDETLVELGLDAAPPAPFAALTRPGLAVTVGSMSKSFWGGLRIGWLRAEPDVVRRCARVLSQTQLALPVLDQLAACALLDVSDEVLPARRRLLRDQRDALVRALRRELPAWRVPVPAGGLVLWCGLPDSSSTRLAARAPEHGLRLAAGPRFSPGGGHDDRLRLPYTAPVEELETAVGRLAALAGAAPGRPRTAPDEAARLVV